jgi:hypothetical protein
VTAIEPRARRAFGRRFWRSLGAGSETAVDAERERERERRARELCENRGKVRAFDGRPPRKESVIEVGGGEVGPPE